MRSRGWSVTVRSVTERGGVSVTGTECAECDGVEIAESEVNKVIYQR